MGLAHRDRELGFPASVQFAETGVAIAVRIALDVLIPEDRQRDVLALQLPMSARPVGLDLPPVTLLRPGIGEQPGFERGIGQLLGQRPAQAGSLEATDRRPHRRRGHSDPTSDLTGRYATNELQPKNFAHLAHGRSLCWHPVPPLDSQRSGPESASRGTPPPGEVIPEWWATSSRNGGRDHLGIGGRHHPGMRGGFTRNRHNTYRKLIFWPTFAREACAITRHCSLASFPAH